MKEIISANYQDKILDALAYHFPDARKIYLFGSRARGTHHEGSDADIAVLCDKKIDLRELDRARVTLDHLPIGINVDLVDLQRVPPKLREIIENKGILWKS